MRIVPRPPLRALVAVLLLLVPAVASCSSGGDAEDAGPTVTATGPSQKAGSTAEPPGSAGAVPTDESSELPEAVAALCTPYAAMVDAVRNATTESFDPAAIAAEIGPVMKEFAAHLPSLERPRGMSAATWRGIQALAERILALPDEPSNAELEAVERDLSEQERDAVKTASDWLRTNCPV